MPACEHRIFTAEDLEDLIITDAKEFLPTVDKEKLMRSREDDIREQEQEVSERLKKIARELSQKEKEISKLKEQIIKIVMGESQLPEDTISDMIKSREADIVELRKRQDAAQGQLADLDRMRAARKAVCDGLDTWAARFDAQELMDKKAMLINIIERITILETDIEVIYQIKLEDMGVEDDLPPDGDYRGDTDGEQDSSLVSPFSILRGYDSGLYTGAENSGLTADSSQNSLYFCIHKQYRRHALNYPQAEGTRSRGIFCQRQYLYP